MREIPVSKFKATCLSVIDEVQRTGATVRLTKYGRPVAQLGPSRSERRVLGKMRGKMKIVGDIVGPIGAFDNWWAAKD